MKIRIRDVKKSFGDFVALDNVNIEFAAGEFTTLLGPSGCGKTTLLRLIAGLEQPDQGEIYFDDWLVFSKEKGVNVLPEKRGLGFVFQDFALWPHMNVFENVAFGLRVRKEMNDLKNRVNRALKAVQLQGKEHNYPHELSGGQQQRVAFARAIVIEPKCILFDEPLSALDALLREEMRREIKDLMKERSITSIFVTHDQLEAMSMSDSVAVVLNGKIAQMGSPEDIYNEPKNEQVAKFIGHSNWLHENQMIRPEDVEAVLYTKESKEVDLQGYIKDINFIGERYELIVETNAGMFTVLTKERWSRNDRVGIRLDNKKIKTF